MAQKQKCNLQLYQDFLIANQNRYSSVELSRVAPDIGMAHDSVTRWLKGYGEVMVTRLVLKNGDTRYLTSSDLSLADYETFVDEWRKRWPIEMFHQGLKQTTGVGNCSAQRTHAQKIHIFSSMVAFLKLEAVRQKTGRTWYEQKAEITRPATRSYLASA